MAGPCGSLITMVASEVDLRRWLDAGVAAVQTWQDAFAPFEPDPSVRISDDHFAGAFADFTERLRDNYPFFHPAYAGQMLKPPHPAAVVGYLTAMLINPNNPSGPFLNTGTTLGYMSIPLFTMNGADAGISPQSATISLGGFLSSSLLTAPFNSVNNGSSTTIVPTLGFTLIGNARSAVSVTVSQMRQFAVGIGPS